MNKRKINNEIKNDYKILRDNKNLIYLNSSTTSLKPDIFVNKLNYIYSNEITYMGWEKYDDKDKNIISQEELYFETLSKVSKYINANEMDVIPTFGATDSINKIARSEIFRLNDGDEIILGKLEHSSNVIPWIGFIKELNKNIKIRWYEIKNDWTINLDHLKKIINKNTKLISIAKVYNTTGAVNDIKKVRKVIGPNIKLSVDAAQAIGHIKVDVLEGDVDFLYFSAHKVFGPYSLGFIYIKNLQKKKNPFSYGGKMNNGYDEKEIKFKSGRKKFITGSQDVPGVISFKNSIEYIDSFDIKEVEEHNNLLKKYAEKKLGLLPNIKIINKGIKSSNLFFEVIGIAGEDVGFYLLKKNIIVSWGSNCVKMKNNNYESYRAIRVSFHIYNTKKDVDSLYREIKNGGDFIDILFQKRRPSKICK